jgi:hypothetical protein
MSCQGMCFWILNTCPFLLTWHCIRRYSGRRKKLCLQSLNIYVHRNDAKTYRLCPFTWSFASTTVAYHASVPFSNLLMLLSLRYWQRKKRQTFCMRANMTSTWELREYCRKNVFPFMTTHRNTRRKDFSAEKKEVMDEMSLNDSRMLFQFLCFTKGKEYQFDSCERFSVETEKKDPKWQTVVSSRDSLGLIAHYFEWNRITTKTVNGFSCLCHSRNSWWSSPAIDAISFILLLSQVFVVVSPHLLYCLTWKVLISLWWCSFSLFIVIICIMHNIWSRDFHEFLIMGRRWNSLEENVTAFFSISCEIHSL